MLGKIVLLHLDRHPFYNVQSLLLAREKYFGNRDGWYSIKPPEYEQLANLTPIEQVVGQVYHTKSHLGRRSGADTRCSHRLDIV